MGVKMAETQNIQWFPGHMAKTRRLIKESLPQVDIIVEITDSRIPKSSRNPELDKWVENKPRIIVLNKCDAADNRITNEWIEYYKSQGIGALATDCKSGKGVKSFLPLVRSVLSELIERRKRKGMVGRPIRMMIVGIPNVGKSSFINRMANSKRAKVEDRPGVTRGRQWVSIDRDMDLLDMPGVLWPKFDDQSVGEKLAFTGAIKDDVIDIELLAMRLLWWLYKEYPSVLTERYKLDDVDVQEPFELLEMVGRKRGMLISGGEVNTERAAIMVMDEYRGGKLGNISLERPRQKEKKNESL
ncbi:MAG: ribosome biosis GTP-binding protein YlqF [Oscillospiraceae bacterium]|nr:ribosome biosis GTP-binding protein YlqF [Oscillospiraceae bacterium]